jgi:hypothetical protein
MNGEQFSVLVFGPKIKFNIKECVDKFNLINKRQWGGELYINFNYFDYFYIFQKN